MIESPNRALEAKRREIAEDVEAFLASGGKIRSLPIVASEEERKAVDAPWTASLGPLSRPRKKGEWTVTPGWESRPAPMGRKPKPYKCEDCGDTDVSKRADHRHLCLPCKALRRKARNANLCRTGRKGRAVRIWREGESLEFATGREAAQHIGVVPSSVCTALRDGREVRGWRVEYVES